MSEQTNSKKKELTTEEKLTAIMGKAFAVDSFQVNASELTDVDAILVKRAVASLKAKFGPDFVMLHASSEKELQAFYELIEEPFNKGLTVVKEDITLIVMWEGLTVDKKKVEYTYSVTLGPFISSTLIVEIQQSRKIRNVLADVEAKVAIIKEKESIMDTELKVSQAKPEYLARQKMTSGINVTHRNSSVQASADFARQVYKIAGFSSAAFGIHQNLIEEMTTVKEKLGMTEEEMKDGAVIGSSWISKAISEFKKIDELRKGFEKKAIKALGERNLMNSEAFIKSGMKEEGRYAWSTGLEMWTADYMSTGDKKSLLNKTMTDHDKYVLGLANEDYAKAIEAMKEQGLAEFAQAHGEENALLKITIATYIKQYDGAKDSKNFSILWDVFMKGIKMALMELANESDTPFVYHAPTEAQFVFFTHDSATARAEGIAELFTKKQVKKHGVGDIVQIVRQGDAMGLLFEAGFFPVKIDAKSASTFPLVSDDMFYTAVIQEYNETQIGKDGVSIKLKDFLLNGEAIASSTLEEARQEEEVMEAVASQQFYAFELNQDGRELVAHHGADVILGLEFEFLVEDGGTNGYLLNDGNRYLLMTSDEMVEDVDVFSCDGTTMFCK